MSGYKAIADELRARIASGEFAPGERLTPENKLKEEYSVERTTIRRALALLVDEGLITKRPGYGNVVNGSLESNTPLISFIVSSPHGKAQYSLGNIIHPFIGPIYDEFSKLCEHEGFRSISMTVAGVRSTASLLQALDTSRAVIIADNVPHEFSRLAKQQNVPCVLMSEREFGFRSVLCDNDSGLEQAVGHLASLGHKRIAYLGGDRTFLNSRARSDGFRRAMFSHGLYDERPITELCGWSISDGFECAKRLLCEHPEITAVCAANDAVALGVCRAAEELGRSVPDKLSVIGFGDTLDSETAQLSLSTVRISTKRFARELMFALKRELDAPYENPGVMLVEAELVVRNTTAICIH